MKARSLQSRVLLATACLVTNCGAFSVLDSASVFVDSVAAPAGPVADPDIVSALEDMGFPRVRCEKATINTQNAGVEEAMNWLLAHMEDAGKCSSLQDRRHA
jgi:hypothetical protein